MKLPKFGKAAIGLYSLDSSFDRLRLSADRAVRAYDACIARHSQDVVTAALNLGTQLMQIKPPAW